MAIFLHIIHENRAKCYITKISLRGQEKNYILIENKFQVIITANKHMLLITMLRTVA